MGLLVTVQLVFYVCKGSEGAKQILSWCREIIFLGLPT